MYIQRIIVFKLIYVFLYSWVSATWNTQDYMKRDHSLIKPYQGKGIEL